MKRVHWKMAVPVLAGAGAILALCPSRADAQPAYVTASAGAAKVSFLGMGAQDAAGRMVFRGLVPYFFGGDPPAASATGTGGDPSTTCSASGTSGNSCSTNGSTSPGSCSTDGSTQTCSVTGGSGNSCSVESTGSGGSCSTTSGSAAGSTCSVTAGTSNTCSTGNNGQGESHCSSGQAAGTVCSASSSAGAGTSCSVMNSSAAANTSCSVYSGVGGTNEFCSVSGIGPAVCSVQFNAYNDLKCTALTISGAPGATGNNKCSAQVTVEGQPAKCSVLNGTVVVSEGTEGVCRGSVPRPQ